MSTTLLAKITLDALGSLLAFQDTNRSAMQCLNVVNVVATERR